MRAGQAPGKQQVRPLALSAPGVAMSGRRPRGSFACAMPAAPGGKRRGPSNSADGANAHHGHLYAPRLVRAEVHARYRRAPPCTRAVQPARTQCSATHLRCVRACTHVPLLSNAAALDRLGPRARCVS